MLVIYHSYGGLAARVAAALHLERLAAEAAPAPGELSPMMSLLAGTGGRPPGLERVGKDAAGHEVYALARNVPGAVIDRVFLGMAVVFKLPVSSFVLVDASLPGEERTFWVGWLAARLGRLAWARRLLSGHLLGRWQELKRRVLETRHQLLVQAGAKAPS